jgi:hypothetical protein
MTPIAILIAALAASVASCSQPLASHPHYVIPGALSDVAYHGDLTLDAYAPRGEPRPQLSSFTAVRETRRPM